MNANIHAAVYHQPWFITPDGWATIDELVHNHSTGAVGVDPEARAGLIGHVRDEMVIDREGIARIDISGPLAPRLGMIEKACGATDYGDLRAELLEANQRARGVLLVNNSPGGACIGCYTIMQQVASMDIPVVAHAQTMACSACYMISSPADKIYAESSAVVGSIGAVASLIERGEELSKMGRRLVTITSTGAEKKVIGGDGYISAEEEERIQAMLDDFVEPIIHDIRSFRDMDDEAYSGQMFVATRAIRLGLIDGISTDEAESRESLLRLIHG